MTAKIVDGKKIAAELRRSISQEVNHLRTKYKTTPNIVTIKIGDDPQSDLYLKLREKACNDVGIKSSRSEFVKTVDEGEVIKYIKKLNLDNNVHGIFIQFPLPEHIAPDKLINAIDPKKDRIIDFVIQGTLQPNGVNGRILFKKLGLAWIESESSNKESLNERSLKILEGKGKL